MASSSSCINNFIPFPTLPSATCNQPFHYKPFLFNAVFSSQQFSHRLDVAASVAFNPSGNYEMSLFDDENDTSRVAPPEPPKAERFEVVIDNDLVKRLDISPFQDATGVADLPSSAELKELLERTVGFTINFERENDYDSRELSEFPEIRLWFLRLDATYPWLPIVLDWRGGELARYAAMLVPHQMSMRMGVVFNPEALELFVMNKVFIVYSYLKKMKVPKPRLKTADMAKMLGFGIGDELFDLIDQQRCTSIDDFSLGINFSLSCVSICLSSRPQFSPRMYHDKRSISSSSFLSRIWHDKKSGDTLRNKFKINLFMRLEEHILIQL